MGCLLPARPMARNPGASDGGNRTEGTKARSGTARIPSATIQAATWVPCRRAHRPRRGMRAGSLTGSGRRWDGRAIGAGSSTCAGGRSCGGAVGAATGTGASLDRHDRRLLLDVWRRRRRNHLEWRGRDLERPGRRPRFGGCRPNEDGRPRDLGGGECRPRRTRDDSLVLDERERQGARQSALSA